MYIRTQNVSQVPYLGKNCVTFQVSDNKENILKDESINRTSTVLHCFYVLATTRTSSIHDIVIKVLSFQNEKAMDKSMTKKMLNLLTQKVTYSQINAYMNMNILRVLDFWCKRYKSFDNLPIDFFGFETADDFLEKHMKWLVTADVLWRHNGVVENSDVFKQFKNRNRKSNEDLIEVRNPNICILYFFNLYFRIRSLFKYR